MIPIAAFFAGALLSLLLPICLLIALVVWYTMFVRRMPDPGAPAGAEAPATPGTERDTTHDA
jgi:uncharacterized membrane protein YhaH (DUF805 family)